MHCEDFPCCGHEIGGCPDENGAFACASCGSKLPKGNRSAVCNACHAQQAREDDDGGHMYPDDVQDFQD
jgi:hypothetical protein